ncbi:FmdB family zinc ribbon protein [Tsukamurella sp. 1534]|uniref:FmdB family zinc ribbon protein n=1 Tax=Tsukamurella sp. 1534 TaxID=1151061 RepID=UPI0002E264FC|nr:FmdB family zinc ribbon protein [Tsukamurella sp. 1534]
MPTYSYACKECGESFDAVQSFSDDPLTVCPHCGGPLRKLFNSVGVVFKGSGFYRTDSRSGKADTTAKSETKSETKTDTAKKVEKATS